MEYAEHAGHNMGHGVHAMHGDAMEMSMTVRIILLVKLSIT